MTGLISELVYLAIAWRLPWWSYGGTLQSWSHLLGERPEVLLLCLAGIAILMIAYLLGWIIVRAGGGKRWIIWGFAGLYAATLFWLLPITSDLFTYLSRAHLFTDLGANPLVEAPFYFRDPLLLAYPTLYATQPSIYGPAWALTSALGTVGPYDVVLGLFYLKGLAVGAYLACAWLVERILQEIRPGAAVDGLFLLTWNPLLLLMAVGDGHNDMVMMAVLMLAVWLLLRERWVMAFGALAFSVWIKYVTVIFLPLFVAYVWVRLSRARGHGLWVPLVKGGLAAAFVSGLVLAPFWEHDTLVGLANRMFRPGNWRGGAPELSPLALGLSMLLCVAACFVLARRVMKGGGSFQELANATFVAALTAFVLGAVRSQPWHLIWPAVLAALSDRRWVWPLVGALSAGMLIVQIGVEWSELAAKVFR
jgi:hypothetical protein